MIHLLVLFNLTEFVRSEVRIEPDDILIIKFSIFKLGLDFVSILICFSLITLRFNLTYFEIKGRFTAHFVYNVLPAVL